MPAAIYCGWILDNNCVYTVCRFLQIYIRTMKKYGIFSALALVFAFILSACGGGGELTLGPFPAIEKTEGDAAFALVAPTSKSPADFVFSSSDPIVATISGKTVTVLRAGKTTITASQPTMGQWSSASTSAVLTVLPRACTAPLVPVSGACVKPCIEPATRPSGVCVAPAASGAAVARNLLTWTPTAFAKVWTDAEAYCSTTTINAKTGWRLPTEFELADLAASGVTAGQGWVLARTWSSTRSDAAAHLTVDLANPATPSASHLDDNSAYVTCVKTGS